MAGFTELSNVMIPGDEVKLSSADTLPPKLILGPGLRREGERIIVHKPGILRFKSDPSAYWIDSHSKRYVAVLGDRVLGVVTQRLTDGWKVDIASYESAFLSFLSFEGATKRNRPNVNVGDVLYCQISVAVRDMEPEVICIDHYGKSRGMGVLSPDGYIFCLPLHIVRKLLSTEYELLTLLGKHIRFEITCGFNGRVYIKSSSVKETVGIANALSLAEYADNSQLASLVSQVVDALKGFD